MANEEHLRILKQGVHVWNQWRKVHPEIRPDLEEADLSRADLSHAFLWRADFRDADLYGANLSGANLSEANLSEADLSHTILSEADLSHAILSHAILFDANLSEANLYGANLSRTDLSGADLSRADLSQAILVGSYLIDTTLRDCCVYGISVWDIHLNGAEQLNLIITPVDQPIITVDNLKVAQFIYLLLNNTEIREVIDTITSKAVLILGRFTPERKAVLDALREELRKHNYLPILFDFEIPSNRDVTETVKTLAHMARFIIADLTEPSSIPKELEAIVPTLAVPVQPILEGATRPYSMFKDYWKYQWVLKVYRYDGIDGLLASLNEQVIAPAESKAKELAKLRAENTN